MQRAANQLGNVEQTKVQDYTEAGSVTLTAAMNIWGKEPRTCQQNQRHIESLIQRYLTEEDKRKLIKGMETDIRPTASDMARFYVGGKDCKHKNVSPGDDKFLNELTRRIALRQQRGKQGSTQPASAGFASLSASPMKALPILILGSGAVVLAILVATGDKKKK